MENITGTIISIDAWRDQNGWTWNNQFKLQDYAGPDFTARKFTRYMRAEGYLSEQSRGRVRVVDGEYCLEIQDKNTGEPIFALIFDSY